MRERLKALRRVLRVHELIEEMREAELLRAATEVREAELAIATQRAIVRSSSAEWRDALLRDDRVASSVSVVEQKAARWREALLVPVLTEREQRSNMSRERHLASRQWTERMRRLTEQVEENLNGMEDKRLQGEADDRYLSRRRWTQSKNGEID
jgi:hypothetical protein